MPLQDIINKIKQESEIKIKEIEQAAEKQLKELAKEYQHQFDAKKEKLLQRKKQQAQNNGDQLLFQEKIKNNAALLNKKGQIIDLVYQQALDELINLPNNDYIELVGQMINQLPDLSQGKILPTPDKIDLIRQALEKSKKKFELAKETADIKGGFIFTSPKINIDGSFEQLIEKARGETEEKVAKTLFSNS